MGQIRKGFSLIELMVVMAVFLIVTSAVFGLLASAQRRYRSEQQLVEALQGARVAIDQIARDIHRAGYPPSSGYDGIAGITVNNGYVTDPRAASRIPGMVAGQLTDRCLVDTVSPALSTCDVPNPFELLLEGDLDPENTDVPEQVERIYYRVDTPGNAAGVSPPVGGDTATVDHRTLYRMVSDKLRIVDPRVPGVTYRGTPVDLVPLVEDVINDPALLADPSQHVFRYVCANGVPACSPSQIEEIHVVLNVQTRSPNLLVPQSGGMLNYRTVTLQTVARVVNPTQ